MKVKRAAIWLGFILCIVVMQFQINRLTAGSSHHYGIVDFEFAKRADINTILTDWNDHQLLPDATINTIMDFAFIIFYVMLVIMLSYRRMQGERTHVLNNLLRLNFLLIIIAGLLDVTEDIFLLRNIHVFTTTGHYVSTYWIALAKFVLAGWTVLVWLISLFASVTNK